MTTFNSTFDWDANLPPSLSSLDENDFLLLLQKQFPMVNAGDYPIPPGALSKGQHIDGTNDPPVKFPLPSTNSPSSSDSSAGPPSPNDDGSTNGSTENIQHKRSDSGDDEHHKRKVSADDFDDDIGGQPLAKALHTDSKTKKSSSNPRRKSAGSDKTQDESRLLKRKEQNRAAQRAFRERKEKHVKDLEDKVAQLEAKTESQAAENENLRDMLSRLQSENMMLKQTAFTFSVQPSNSNVKNPKSDNDTDNDSESNNNNNYTDVSTQERRNSGARPESHSPFSNDNAVPGPSSVPQSAGSSIRTASTHDSPSSLFESYDGLSVIQKSEAHPASSSTSVAPSSHDSSSPDLETIAYFGAPGPFTTISSNPMFTSYRDPMLSMNAFASFGGWDSNVTTVGASSTQETSNSGLEELFGEQFSGLVPFSADFLNGDVSAGSPSGPSVAARLSPVAHHKGKTITNHTTCPKTKGDIERLVATGGRSTFGSPPQMHEKPAGMSSMGRPNTGSVPGRQYADYDAAVDQTFGIPPKKEYSDNCNIDELCLEMQRKARCSYAASTASQ